MEQSDRLDQLLEKGLLQEILSRSCQAKADVVSKDEKKQVRAILNYGHTIGHAVKLNGLSFIQSW